MLTGTAPVAVNKNPMSFPLVSAWLIAKWYWPLPSSPTVPVALACEPPSIERLAVTVAPVRALPFVAFMSAKYKYWLAVFFLYISAPTHEDAALRPCGVKAARRSGRAPRGQVHRV